VIVPYQDGPYLVRGPVMLLDQDGHDIELNRRTVALCRCGKSRMRPFCDGTHRMIGFRVPSAQERPRARNSEVSAVGAAPLDGAYPRYPAERRSTSPSDRVSSNGSRTEPCTHNNAASGLRTDALRTAESLLIAARLQLKRTAADEAAHFPDGLESTWAEPALCLVMGAQEALRPFADDDAPDISRVVKELTALTILLRTTSRRA
jgi:CDGSH-type Zn-finger protein